MNTESQKLFNSAILTLMGDNPLPQGLDMADLSKRMESFYDNVIAKNPDKVEMTTFFMTFLAGYLSGYSATVLQQMEQQKGKAWIMPDERN